MKILITGGTGFVGKNLKLKLISLGHRVFNIARGFNHSDIPMLYPDVIIHCAAECRDSSKMFESNIVLTHNLLAAVRKVDYKRFIYIGSSSEYGTCGIPQNETMAICPRDTYEATKGSGTLLCLAEAFQYNKPVVVVRPYSLYGMHEREDRLMPTIFRNFKENFVSIIDKNAVHDWVYIDDFIDVLITLMDCEIKKKGEIVNVGTGVQNSNFNVISILQKIIGPIKWTDAGKSLRNYDTVNSWVCDTWYARQVYGISCMTTLDCGLSKYWEAVR